MNKIILEAIEDAKLKAEAMIPGAEVWEACCEQDTYETEAKVMEAEAVYMVNNTEAAGVALDRAYNNHDKAMREYYEAKEEVRNLHKIVELLDEATWYV